MTKSLRAGILMTVFVIALVALAPACVAATSIGTTATDYALSEAGFRLEAPAGVNRTAVEVSAQATNPDKIVPVSDYYVTRSLDVQMVDRSGGIVRLLAKPARMVFTFNYIDFKRASKMNTGQPVGRFRVGYWDESGNKWVELPSQVFWNGSNGAVEAETDRGDGRYALIWSYRGDVQLSQVAGKGIRVMINNAHVGFTDAPYVKDNRTMVPLRAISENLGAQVNWISSESRIDMVRNSDAIKLWIGKKEASKNGQTLSIDVAPEVVNDRTFVPLRFIAEAFGASVNWDDVTQTVKIFSNN